ncbi:MAG: MFS transporter [Firmicutes bacterium]|nr:MFS transporter [Alicyclobacillaceae bacterium]MCL6497084.1 MFS transporter [Bacillota bacterium]
MGLMITAVDTTIVVLGLPVIMRDLHATLASVVWVIMVYLLVLTLLATQVGRLGDLYGRSRMYNLGFAIFTLGSVLCGLSQSAPELIGFRVLQAIGGALITANSGAIVADAVPGPKRGRAFGITSIGWNIGAILGILLGGILITYVSWRAVFYINLPIGVAALLLGYRWLPRRDRGQRQPLDPVGMVLLGAGLSAVLFGLTRMTGTGFTAAVGALVAVGLGFLAGFAAWEARHPSPLVSLDLFRHRVLSASILASFFQSLGGYAVLFLVIMFLQGVRGLSPFSASLLLVPGYLVGGAIGPWAGHLADRWGSRVPATVGLLVQVVGIAIYGSLTVGSPLWHVALASLINGLGSGAFYPANNSAVVVNAPPSAYGVANGLLRTFANVGMVSSFAVSLLVASMAIPRQAAFAIFLGVTQLGAQLGGDFVRGLHAALGTAIALILVAALLSILRGAEPARRASH